MGDNENTEPGISRRTVAKAMAWTVPAIAVAATVPLAAASTIPPPQFSFTKGCASVGNTKGACGDTNKTPQVPAYVMNTTTQTVVLQITSALSREAGSGTNFSDYKVTNLTNGTSDEFCGPQVGAVGCGGFPGFVLAPGEAVDFWVVGHQFGNSADFEMKISYRFTVPVTGNPGDTCSTPGKPVVLLTGSTSFTPIPPSNNCDGHTVCVGPTCA